VQVVVRGSCEANWGKSGESFLQPRRNEQRKQSFLPLRDKKDMTSQRHFSTLRLLSGQWRWRETGILVTQLCSAVETFWKQLQALMQAPPDHPRAQGIG
jgi:hypothetical protein